jgi:hypothetical protein
MLREASVHIPQTTLMPLECGYWVEVISFRDTKAATSLYRPTVRQGLSSTKPDL